MVKYWAAVLQKFPSFFHLEQWGMILGDDEGNRLTASARGRNTRLTRR